MIVQFNDIKVCISKKVDSVLYLSNRNAQFSFAVKFLAMFDLEKDGQIKQVSLLESNFSAN